VSFIKKHILVASGVPILLFVFILAAWPVKKTDPRLASPKASIQGILQPKLSLFLSPEFYSFLPQTNQSLLPTRAEAVAAAENKSLFWQLHREHHFNSIFLGTNPAWHPLIDSLFSSSLWVLADISPWGYLFNPAPDAKAWKIPSEAVLKNQWPDATDRTRFLILTAANLAAIHRNPEAEQLLSMAMATHKLPSQILSTRASLAAAQGRWKESATLAQQSLHSDRENLIAKKILTRDLIELGEPDEALDNARELATTNPQDQETLFLLARTANAANSSQEEIDALTHLASLARTTHQPLGVILTYLGQAYAKSGDRGDALRAFQEAILSPELSDKEHLAIREIMDHLMEGNASSTTLPPIKSVPSTNP